MTEGENASMMRQDGRERRRFALSGGSVGQRRELGQRIVAATADGGVAGLVSDARMAEAAMPFADSAAQLAYARAHQVLQEPLLGPTLVRVLDGVELLDLDQLDKRGVESQLRSIGLPIGEPLASHVPVPVSELVSSCSCGAPYPEIEGESGLLKRLRSQPHTFKRLYRRLMLRHFLGGESTREPIDSEVPADVCAVTCFFDPCSSSRRAENLRQFNREFAATRVPLLTVIGEFPGAPQLPDPEYGQVLRVPCLSVLWQKERLLNLGIRHLLDGGAEKIAWIDADVVIEQPGSWGQSVSHALESVPLIQGFSSVRMLEPGRLPSVGMSCVRNLQQTGRVMWQPRIYAASLNPFGVPHGVSGYVWAARAGVLRQCLLYERAIIGGGDKLMYVAACAPQEKLERCAKTLTRSPKPPCARCGERDESPAFRMHYLTWAERWRAAIRAQAETLRSPPEAVADGTVGWVDHTVTTLAHGTGKRRWYNARRHALLRNHYDPSIDVDADEGCGLSWASPKQSMHHSVLNYFFERQEDVLDDGKAS